MFNKHHLRNNLLSQRNQLTRSEINNASRALNQIILKENNLNNKKIAFYKSVANEINPNIAIEYALENNTKCYLPKISKQTKDMSFLSYLCEEDLVINEYSIPEPVSPEKIAPDNLDIVFVPLVGFDLEGNRLGRGAGYYDRTFQFKKSNRHANPKLIGLAYQFQLIDHLPIEKHDVPLDQVITEQNHYKFNLIDN